MRPLIANLCFCSLIIAVAISTAQVTVGQTLYSVTIVGESFGTGALATGINNRGQVTGVFAPALESESGHEVFFWDPVTGGSVISGPDPRPGSIDTNYSSAINDSGLVVGTFDHRDLETFESTFFRSFTWTPESGTTVFDELNFAVDVNNLGTVLSPQVFDSIPDDPSLSIYSLSAINDLGQIVGQVDTRGQAINAFIWDPTTGLEIIEIPFSMRPPFPDSVDPEQLNNKGQVVGLWSRYVGPPNVSPDALLTEDLFERTAFLWSGGQITDLGALPGLTLSDANAINEDSIKVGYSSKGSGLLFLDEKRAVIWDSENVIADLNNLLDETGDGWTLLEAKDINDAGQIVGSGTSPAGLSRAFLLTPISEVGDCDQDGDVDFADIPSFIDILSTGSFLQQADCNRDGEVTFADIPAFIEILSGV